MKTFVKSKYFIGGMIVGLSLLSVATYASVAGAGTLGALFDKVGSVYKLRGDEIKDNTIDNTEIEDNSIKSEDIKNGEIKSEDINSSYALWNKSGNNLYYNGGKVGIGINSPAAQLEVKNGNDAFKMGQIQIHHTNEINNQSGNLYLQYRGGKNTILNKGGGNVGIGTSSPGQKLDVNGNIKTSGRNIYFGNSAQRLYGDNGSAFYMDSNNSDYTQLIFRDKEDKTYGRIYGSGNGSNFGLLDGDGNWSYLAVKDNYTSFRINNSEKMRIKSNGNIGIGTSSPNANLHIKGDGRIRLDGKNNSSYWDINARDDGKGISIVRNGTTNMTINSDGKLRTRGGISGIGNNFYRKTATAETTDKNLRCPSGYKVLIAGIHRGYYNDGGTNDGLEKASIYIDYANTHYVTYHKRSRGDSGVSGAISLLCIRE